MTTSRSPGFAGWSACRRSAQHLTAGGLEDVIADGDVGCPGSRRSARGSPRTVVVDVVVVLPFLPVVVVIVVTVDGET